MKKRILSLIMTMLMLVQCISMVPFTASAAEGDTYELVELANIQATDTVIIVSTKDTATYALSNGNGTDKAPTAVAVTVTSEGITTDATNIQWNISNDDGGLTVYPAGTTETWLYCTSTNNGVRVGTNTNKVFTIDAATGYLKHTATSRYLGVYNSQDWRCYTNTTGNTAGQTFTFYKLKAACTHESTTAIGEYIAPSCTETGMSAGVKCVDCGVEIEPQAVIEATGHTAPNAEGKCDTCGATVCTDHDFSVECTIASATCTEPGEAGLKCSICGEISDDNRTVIDPTGHSMVTDAPAVDATCTTPGSTAAEHCSECDYVVEAAVVDALGHNYVDGVCSVCDEEQPTTLTINRTSFGEASNYAWHAWTATTTTGETISGSGYIYGSEKTNIQVNAKTEANGNYIYNSVALPGSITSIKVTAGKTTYRNFVVITSDTPFDSSTNRLTAPEGSMSQLVNAEGATWTFTTNHKYFAIIAPDAGAAYLSSIEIAYSVCDHENKVAIGEAKDATCTEDGITAGEKCADCGEVITAQETIDALGHTDVDPADSKCDTCGANLCTDHTWVDNDEPITAPSCTATGLIGQHCSVCGEPNPTDRVMDKVAHTPKIDEAVDATCIATGLTEGSHCSVCDEVLKEQTEVPMVDHNYVDNKCTMCNDILVTGTQLAEFQFGENGDASHKDGTAIDRTPFASGNYTLELTNSTNVYDGAFDAKGNSALKLGTGSATASFSFTVDDNVNTVVLYIAGYKANTATIVVNETEYPVSSKSNDGDYTKIVVDTSTTKTITLATSTNNGADKRAMIDSIEFWGEPDGRIIEDGLHGSTVTLGDNIGVNFYMNLIAETLADSTAYVEFTLPNGTTEKVYVKDVKSNLTEHGYKFTANIAVKEMADTITAKLVTAKGESTEYSNSVKQYAMYIVNATSGYTDKEVALAKAMLNYGAYAQVMFDHNTENLANSEIDSTLGDVTIADTYAKVVEGTCTGATYLGTSTMWESDTAIRHYFDITDETVTFKLYDANDGFIKDLTVQTSGDNECVAIDGIVAKDMSTTYKLVVSNGTDTQTITYSVYSYFYDVINGSYTEAEQNAMKAGYLYAEAATAYLAEKNN